MVIRMFFVVFFLLSAGCWDVEAASYPQAEEDCLIFHVEDEEKEGENKKELGCLGQSETTDDYEEKRIPSSLEISWKSLEV
jgi:hypothetical protein